MGMADRNGFLIGLVAGGLAEIVGWALVSGLLPQVALPGFVMFSPSVVVFVLRSLVNGSALVLLGVGSLVFVFTMRF